MYIISLPSSSAPGLPCYLAAPGATRSINRLHAARFDTEAAARAALDDARESIRYRAPETLSPGLRERLDEAVIEPALFNVDTCADRAALLALDNTPEDSPGFTLLGFLTVDEDLDDPEVLPFATVAVQHAHRYAGRANVLLIWLIESEDDSLCDGEWFVLPIGSLHEPVVTDEAFFDNIRQQVRAHLKEHARDKARSDVEWRRERANEAGMGLGVDAYNDVWGHNPHG
jgi:hypothetical protein